MLLALAGDDGSAAPPSTPPDLVGGQGLLSICQSGFGSCSGSPCRTGRGSLSARAGSQGIVAADSITDKGMELGSWSRL